MAIRRVVLSLQGTKMNMRLLQFVENSLHLQSVVQRLEKVKKL